MDILIRIPNEEIQTEQSIISIDFHFIDKKLCECDYPYQVLPANHGDLIDRNEISRTDYRRLVLECNGNFKDALVTYADKVLSIPAVIEADIKEEVPFGFTL